MADVVDRVRAFNREWTEVVGLLDHGLLETEYSLPQARVLFELHREPLWALSRLRERLGIDKSFLTRVVTSLEADGLVALEPSPTDARRKQVSLTPEGHRAAERLARRSRDQVSDVLAHLSPAEQASVTEAMTMILGSLGRLRSPELTVRPLEPGDLGWVVMQHGELYHDEYGWNTEIESLCARILADFHDGFVDGREQGFIAEINGARAGSLFLMEKDEDTAQIRLVVGTPWSRGNGLGRRLVGDAIDFARAAGYATVTLWTNSVLAHARTIYEQAGFVLVDAEDHYSFGVDLTGQTWELDLRRV